MKRYEELALLILALGTSYSPKTVAMAYHAVKDFPQQNAAIIDGCKDSTAKMALDLLGHTASPGSVAPEWFAHTQAPLEYV